jgi:hypothetical protein
MGLLHISVAFYFFDNLFLFDLYLRDVSNAGIVYVIIMEDVMMSRISMAASMEMSNSVGIFNYH